MRHRLTLGLLAATGAVLAGCASAPDGAVQAEEFECPLGTEGCDVNEPVGPGGQMAVTSSVGGDEFSFQIDDGLAATGAIEVDFTNAGTTLHNVEFLGAAEGSEVVEAVAGESDTGTVALFPGTWTFICNVPGHRANGMEATVTVFASEEELEEAEAEGVEPGGEDEEAVAAG